MSCAAGHLIGTCRFCLLETNGPSHGIVIKFLVNWSLDLHILHKPQGPSNMLTCSRCYPVTIYYKYITIELLARVTFYCSLGFIRRNFITTQQKIPTSTIHEWRIRILKSKSMTFWVEERASHVVKGCYYHTPGSMVERIMYLIGCHNRKHRPMRRSIYRSLLDRPSTNTRLTCWSTIDRESTDVFIELPLMSAEVSTMTISGAYRSTIGGMSSYIIR